MKKLLSVVLVCLIILLVGCSNEKTVKETATSEFNNDTSFPAGITEAEKPQEGEIVESSVQVTEKEREEKPVEHKEQETKQKSDNRKTRLNRKQQPNKPNRKIQKKNLRKSQSQPKQQSLQKKHLM